MKRLLLILACIMLLMMVVGCAEAPIPQRVEVTTFVPVVCEEAPSADRIRMLEATPVPIRSTHGAMWVAFTPKHYENLAKNQKAILKNMKQKNSIIKYYRECISKAKEVSTVEYNVGPQEAASLEQ